MDVTQKTVLFVDDEENIVELYKLELEERGYNVITAADGVEALKIMKEKAPGTPGGIDLLVLDIKMPGMNGLEVLGKVRENHKEGDFPIILHSQYDTYTQDFTSWLADYYVIKSSNINALAEKIEKLLE